MEQKLPKIECHLFVCTNHREVGEDCSKKGSVELHQQVKDAVKSDPSLKDRVKVSKSGCLGFCSVGIAAVMYPDGNWLTDLKKEDAPKLLTKIKSKLKDSGT